MGKGYLLQSQKEIIERKIRVKQDLNCEIVEDLLPNYIEKLTSDFTNESIKNHLNTCERCENTFNLLNEEVMCKESKDIKKFQTFLRKIKIKNIILGSILAIIFFFIAINAYRELFIIHGTPIRSNEVNISEVAEFSDGRIHCRITVNGDYIIGGGSVSPVKGTSDSIIQLQTTIVRQKSTDNSLISKGICLDQSFVIDLNDTVFKKTTALYFQGKDENDRILIWNEGMSIPKASEEIELKYRIKNGEVE